MSLPLSPPSPLFRAGEIRWQEKPIWEGVCCGVYSAGFTTPRSTPWMETSPHHWGFRSHSPLITGFWCSHEAVQRPHHCSRESLPHFLFCSPNWQFILQHIPQPSSRLAHWRARCTDVMWFTKPRTEKLGNIRFTFAHATWNLPTHTSVHWVTQGCWWNAWS